MSIKAVYYEIEQNFIDELKKKNQEELVSELEKLEVKCDLDKMWDGLHYLITGNDGSEIVEENMLSEAVFGTQAFIEDENAEFIAYIDESSISNIVKELENVNIDVLLDDFSPKDFQEKEIYPDIWIEEDVEKLKKELLNSYNLILNFYKMIDENKKGVIVSII